MKDGYIVAQGYYRLPKELKAKICNGAGAAGDWKSFFIPNTLYGLDCSPVFNIHDYAYWLGRTQDDKRNADTAMLLNLFTLISSHNGMLSPLRRYRAVTYYIAVHRYGDSAFYIEEKGNIDLRPPAEEPVIYGSTIVR